VTAAFLWFLIAIGVFAPNPAHDAVRAGYRLGLDTERSAELQQTGSGQSEQFNTTTAYLVATTNGNHLRVTIDRDTAGPVVGAIAELSSGSARRRRIRLARSRLRR
jgi:hypothetical protein